MREILFRGKDIKGNWYEGLLAHNIAKDEWYISNKAGISTAYQVRPETIGQFTGLTDKNGNKIFEGDIVETMSIQDAYGTDKFYVRFVQGNFYACLGGTVWTLRSCAESVKVVVNIYDNPEMVSQDTQ